MLDAQATATKDAHFDPGSTPQKSKTFNLLNPIFQKDLVAGQRPKATAPVIEHEP